MTVDAISSRLFAFDMIRLTLSYGCPQQYYPIQAVCVGF